MHHVKNSGCEEVPWTFKPSRELIKSELKPKGLELLAYKTTTTTMMRNTYDHQVRSEKSQTSCKFVATSYPAEWAMLI